MYPLEVGGGADQNKLVSHKSDYHKHVRHKRDDHKCCAQNQSHTYGQHAYGGHTYDQHTYDQQADSLLLVLYMHIFGTSTLLTTGVYM